MVVVNSGRASAHLHGAMDVLLLLARKVSTDLHIDAEAESDHSMATKNGSPSCIFAIIPAAQELDNCGSGGGSGGDGGGSGGDGFGGLPASTSGVSMTLRTRACLGVVT